MFGYLKNYPPPAVRALRHLTAAMSVCLAAIAGVAALALFSGDWLHLAALPLAIILFFILFILLFLLVPGMADWAFRTRIVPVLEDGPGPRPYGEAPLARGFIASGTLGRAVARNYRLLVDAAARRQIPSLEDLGRSGEGATAMPYLEPARAAEPLRRLLEDLRASPPEGTWRPAETIGEIEKLLEVLDEASRNGARVGFAVLHRPW